MATPVLLLMIQTSSAQQIAFPGAEGYGAFASGGRGGVVYEVTNLSDSVAAPQPGSLRWALSDTSHSLPRTIVFRVSGIITLQGRLDVGRNNSSGKCIVNNVTIAGQTAPGDGICLRKYPMKVYATNVIIRYIRFRPGDETQSNSPAIYGIDVENAKNVIVDHCSMSWSIEEAATFYDDKFITVQWCLVSESLNSSFNPKGNHGYGGVWGGQYGTYHHNLLAHHLSRTPRFNGSRAHDTTAIVDFRNNVIYNWGASEGCHGGEVEILNVGISRINMLNNYYKPGPATTGTTRKYLVAKPYDSTTVLSVRSLSQWYITGNYVNGNDSITADNWKGGIQPKYPAKWSAISFKSDSMFTVPLISMQTAQDAYTSVLAGAGATLPKRDSVDLRIINEVTNGTSTYGTGGIINSQSDVGGWPTYNSLPALADADHDGIPDAWEIAQGLNPNDSTDGNSIASSGYTMLEEYLNSINGQTGITSVANEALAPRTFELYQNYPNPFNPSTTISFNLPFRSFVSLKIFNLLGREIACLISENLSAGNYSQQWNAWNLSSGIYFYRLQAGSFIETKKLIFLK
jgi:pectate lyase